MYDRICESISVAISEDASEHHQKQGFSNNMTTERFLEICLDVDGGTHDPKWDNVRQVLKKMENNQKNQIDLITGIGSFSNIPLHLICFKDPPTDIVKKLLQLNPQSVMIPDKEGDLPLHFACLSNSSYEVIKLLTDTYPDGRNIQGELGNTPLHCVLLQEYCDVSLRPEMEDIIQVLLSDEVIHIKDHSGLIPLELFALRLKQQYQEHQSNNNDILVGTTKLAKMLIESYPEEQHKALIKSVSKLPTDIQDEIICSNTHFHKCMDRSSMTRSFTFCNFYMFYVNLFVIASFTSIVITALSKEESNENIDLKWETFGLRIGILSWMVSVFLQLTSSLYNKTFYTSFLLHIPTLIDIASIIFLFHSMYIFQDSFFSEMKINIFWLMDGNEVDSKERNMVLIVTTAMIWSRLFMFLCGSNYSLSLFLSRSIHVITKIIPFFVTIGVMLCAFALMYYIDATNNNITCTEDEGMDSMTFCTIQQSYLRLFSMIINRSIDYPESLLSNDKETTSLTTLWLTICFSLAMLFLLMNLLIASVVESYYSYLNHDRCNKHYWKGRYKQIQDMSFLREIIRSPNALFNKCRSCMKDDTFNNDDVGIGDCTYNDRDALLWSYTWKILSLNNMNDLSSPDENTHWMWASIKSSAIVQFLMKTIALMFVIVWLFLGLVTFGLLLPPQVRRWIISAQESCNSDSQHLINTNTVSCKDTLVTKNVDINGGSNQGNTNNATSKMEQKLYYNMNKMEKQQSELILKYDKVVMLLQDLNDKMVSNNNHLNAIADAGSKKRNIERVDVSSTTVNNASAPSIEVCYSENTNII